MSYHKYAKATPRHFRSLLTAKKIPYLNQVTQENTCQIFQPKKSRNWKFQTQKNPWIIPVTWNLEYTPPRTISRSLYLDSFTKRCCCQTVWLHWKGYTPTLLFSITMSGWSANIAQPVEMSTPHRTLMLSFSIAVFGLLSLYFYYCCCHCALCCRCFCKCYHCNWQLLFL